ncbi:MAG TPA: hemolysin family protein [Chitinophagaceae bacterium]|nr:hemolysin family protein [Chitinophagaceae bacterium]
MINWNTIGYIVLSILLVGFFVGIQIAFISVNKLTVELKKKQGRRSGILLSYFLDEPSKFIGATLIGFNVFLVIYGLLVGEMLAPIWNWLQEKQQIAPAYLNLIKLLFETITSTFIIILFGQFLPKARLRAKSEFILTGAVSTVTNFFYKIFQPVAAILVYVAEGILKYLFNVRVDSKKEPFSRADLEHFFQQSKEQSSDNQDLNTELFENALSLTSVKIRKCLVPRKEIVGIDASVPMEVVRSKFIETQLSKLLVFENNIDHIIGYIHQLDLFKQPPDVHSILLPIPAVPESMSATGLISKFSRERKSIAWVVDEFGGTAGIVTMEDLLEEIFGEIRDEYDTEDFEEKKLSDEEYIFSGRLELDYLNEKYELDLPDNESETLSGFIIHKHETIPKIKERIIIGDYEFDIMSVSDTRIEMVRMKILK